MVIAGLNLLAHVPTLKKKIPNELLDKVGLGVSIHSFIEQKEKTINAAKKVRELVRICASHKLQKITEDLERKILKQLIEEIKNDILKKLEELKRKLPPIIA